MEDPTKATSKEKAKMVELPRMLKLSFEVIQGLHPDVEEIWKDLPPLRQINSKSFSKKSLLNLLEIFPINLCKFNDQWMCTGNIRLYLLAKSRLNTKDKIFCLEVEQQEKHILKEKVLQELLLSASVLGIASSDKKLALKLAKTAAQNKIIDVSETKVEKWIAEIYGVDPRTLKKGES